MNIFNQKTLHIAYHAQPCKKIGGFPNLKKATQILRLKVQTVKKRLNSQDSKKKIEKKTISCKNEKKPRHLMKSAPLVRKKKSIKTLIGGSAIKIKNFQAFVNI